MTAYAELHYASNFSFLRGASHPEELAAQAKHLGLAALAVTDRNSLAGVVRAHAAAKDMGLKFVVGARLDLSSPAGMDADYSGPSLLAYPTTRAAYGNLCRLLSGGQRRVGKGQCRITIDDVRDHDARAFAGKSDGGGPADAGTAAGHPRMLSVQISVASHA